MDTTLLAFGLGPAEIGVLLFVMLFAFGPKRLPELGKSVGEALSSFRKAGQGAEKELSAALDQVDAARAEIKGTDVSRAS